MPVIYYFAAIMLVAYIIYRMNQARTDINAAIHDSGYQFSMDLYFDSHVPLSMLVIGTSKHRDFDRGCLDAYRALVEYQFPEVWDGKLPHGEVRK